MSQLDYAVNDYVERARINLAAGKLGLQDLPSGLQGLYFDAYNAGQLSTMAALDQARHDRDRYYEQLHNPGRQFTDMVQRRIDQAAEQHRAELDAVRYYEHVLGFASTPRRAA